MLLIQHIASVIKLLSLQCVKAIYHASRGGFVLWFVHCPAYVWFTIDLLVLCCRPNCVAKLVDVQGQHRVFIFTMQEIAPLEELT